MIYADARYFQLMMDETEELTEEEIAAGWHFCYSEWDGLLIGKTCAEYELCTCAFKDGSN